MRRRALQSLKRPLSVQLLRHLILRRAFRHRHALVRPLAPQHRPREQMRETMDCGYPRPFHLHLSVHQHSRRRPLVLSAPQHRIYNPNIKEARYRCLKAHPNHRKDPPS